LKEVVSLTKKEVTKQAKENFEAQLRNELNSMEVDDDKAPNNLIGANDSSMEEKPELSQAELEELTGNLSSD
jgi:hypothetical protein